MSETKKNYKVLRCPHCGHQYAPAELFMPSDFAGKPTSIIRDPVGKILYQEYEEGYEPDMSTSYVCDGCDRSFIVQPLTSFRVFKEAEELDFTDLSTSLWED